MATITCPKCGTENSDDAVNCINCRVNLKYALEHPGEMEFAREHPDMFGLVKHEAVQGTPEKAVISRKQSRKKKGRTYLLIAAACFVVYYLMYIGGDGGAIGAVLALAMLICLVVGVIYLIMGSVGEE